MTCDKGMIEDTNYDAVRDRHGQCTININGETMQLKQAISLIKKSTTWEILDFGTRMSKRGPVEKLRHLAKHPHAGKAFKKTTTIEELHQCWKSLRSVRNKEERELATKIIKKCIKYKYKSFTFTPYILRVQCGNNINMKKLRVQLHDFIKADLKTYPDWLINVHLGSCVVVQTRQKNISEHLINMRKHAVIGAQEEVVCTCKCMPKHLPRINGHVFFTGREYAGRGAHIITQNANNIPVHDQVSQTKAIIEGFQTLTKSRNTTQPWTDPDMLTRADTCATWSDRTQKGTCTIKEVMRLKSDLKGLVTGPLDKNIGKLVVCCPCLYKECMDQIYDLNTATHYQQVYPTLFTKKANNKTNEDIINHIATSDKPTKQKESGSEKDILRHWELFYKRKGWDKITPYNSKGKLGYMYAIFKDKNTTDPDIRAQKYKKARPITPYCKHPMKRLLNMAARGWMFLINQFKGNHFILPSTKDLKSKLRQFEEHFKNDPNRDLETFSWDISGCYTNMDKTDIMDAMRKIQKIVKENPTITHEDGITAGMASPAITAKTSKEAINLPKRGKGPVFWGYGNPETRTTITFKQLMDILEFSLNNAFFTHGDKIIQQKHGIPMGDPMSPAICIGTCAILEKQWMDKLETSIQEKVRAVRYLDDIYMVLNKNGLTNPSDITRDFEKKCYPKSLTLEQTPPSEFLECLVHTTKNGDITMQHWNKNNTHIQNTGDQYYYKQQHYNSYAPGRSKTGALIGTWTRVDTNSNRDDLLQKSIQEKIQELRVLQYPSKTVYRTLLHMFQKTQNYHWDPKHFDIFG